MNTKSISLVLFILLFLVGGVLFYAVSKGGLDIRSRASGSACYTIASNLSCPSTDTTSQTSGPYVTKTCCPKPRVSLAPTLMPTKVPCGQNGQACCAANGSECYSGLRCANGKCVVNTPTPTVMARCCPKVNTTYAHNTCSGASQKACAANGSYCTWTYSTYCPF
jgi:hypothetical protein